MSEDGANVRRVMDQFAISDALARYARGVDRRQWEMVRSVFHPDASDDHGAYRGGIDGLIKWVSARHAPIEQAMHFLGNILIEFANDDTALVETYFTASVRLGPEATESRTSLLNDAAGTSHVDTTVLGRYIDRFERRQGEWKIAKRITIYEAIRTQPVADAYRNPDYVWAKRDTSDAVFEMRREIFGR
jgi:hypothetical protein